MTSHQDPVKFDEPTRAATPAYGNADAARVQRERARGMYLRRGDENTLSVPPTPRDVCGYAGRGVLNGRRF